MLVREVCILVSPANIRRSVYLLLQDVQEEFLHAEAPENVVVEESEEQSSNSGNVDSHQVKDNAE